MRNNFIGMFKAEYYRTFQRKVCIKMIVIIAVFNIVSTVIGTQDITSLKETDMIYLFDLILDGRLFELGYIIATATCLIHFCEDIRNKGYYLYSIRSNIDNYILCKFLVSIIFFFMITFLGNLCYIAIGSFIVPLFSGEEAFIEGNLYASVVRYNPLLYFLIRISYISLATTAYGVMGMCFATRMPNRYMVAASPFLFYKLIDVLQSKFSMPVSIYLDWLMKGIDVINQGIGRTMVYTILFFTFIIFMLGIIFVKLMRRRCYGEKN